MALDFTPNTIQQLPEICDFVPEYEKSRMEGHKFVINPVTGDVIAHMGKGFSPAGHRAFCSSAENSITDKAFFTWLKSAASFSVSTRGLPP